MSLLNGSPSDSSDPKQHTTNGLNGNNIYKNSNGRATIDNMDNKHNGLNNNHDEYKMDMKTIASEKVAEDDPLTGHRKWNVVESSKEALKPRWGNRFASTNFFMVIFLLAYVLQGCYFTYFVSVITTIEKLFHIKSASIALLLNFSEIGQICTSLFLTYFAGRGHRPRWIACGMFLFSIAAFGSVSPHFIFGSRLYKTAVVSSNEGMSMMNSQFTLAAGPSSMHGDSSIDISSKHLCLAVDEYNKTMQHDPSEFFQRKFLKKLLNLFSTTACDNNENQENDAEMKFVVMLILAASLCGIGIGQTAISTLGIPYIDDNVKSKQSPLYMAITIGVRVLGPALGYYLGSFCIRLYVDLTNDVDPKDPNFVGAWWLGKLLILS
jgi:MFS family permease